MDRHSSQNMPKYKFNASNIEICDHCLFCKGYNTSDEIIQANDEFFRSDPDLFDILRCASCESLWLSKRPVGSRLLNAYANYYTHSTTEADIDGDAGVRATIRESYFRSRLSKEIGLIDRLVAKTIAFAGYDTSGLDKCMRFVPSPPAKILDYGCGSGKFLLSLRDKGYELHGAEYDPHLLGILSRAGIDIHNVAALTDDSWECTFDHVSLSHVLEHVPDPIALLRRLFRWLKPNGSLYIELPNANATGLTIFGRYWRGLEVPRHFSLPSRKALADAVESVGFIVERQHVDRSARRWIWDESLMVSPQDKHPAMVEAMSNAPPETEDNAELLTFLVRRPA